MAENKDNQFVAGKTEKLLAPTRVYTGEANTGYATGNMFNRKMDKVGSEYPIADGPRYLKPNERGIGDIPYSTTEDPVEAQRHAILKAAQDHRLGDNRNINTNHLLNRDGDGEPIMGQPLTDYQETSRVYHKPEFFVKNRLDHFTRDVPQGIGDKTHEPFVDEEAQVTHIGYPNDSDTPTKIGVFSGATTNVNALDKEEAKEILKAGTYGNYIRNNLRNESSTLNPPIGPTYPGSRMNDDKKDEFLSDISLFNAYNRTRLPIADQEWRKGFRYIFFTRPECYLMYRDGGIIDVCDQTFYDEDFSSAYTRMPHIIKLLSPWYVTGSFPTMGTQQQDMIKESGKEGANWNFLFSNRVQGLSTTGTSMSVVDSVGKSIEGYTVTPAKFVESRQGSTIDLSFNDTRNLEVYEMARLWMLYMYKRQKGIFLPPYNGYSKENGFKVNGAKLDGPLTGIQYTRMHPYDRALEYCASLYDIVTDETGSKILYWCKYYGIYPTAVNPSLNNEANGPITSMQTTITFKYHYKLENSNKTLVEFNHDSGLTDNIGRINMNEVTSSLPFLLRDDGTNPDGNPVMPRYIGAAGMFTGAPYVIMVNSRPEPLNKDKIILTPSLRFMNVPKMDIDQRINMGITNTKIDQLTKNVVAYPSNSNLANSR